MRLIQRSLFAVLASSAAAFAAARVDAQTPRSGSVLQVSPYAGYMVFGDYLSGPFGTKLTNAPAFLYGTQIGLALAPNLSLVGNIGYAAADMRVDVPIFGGLDFGHSTMLISDADLELSLGALSGGALPLTPFLQAGGGVMHYDIDASFANPRATSFVGNLGIGADIAVARGLALRLLAKDYIGRFDFEDATGLDISGNTAHNWGFTAGLRVDF